MAQVTAPVILDSTGQQIVTALNNLSNNVKPTADQIKRTSSNNQTVEAAIVSLNSQLKLKRITKTYSNLTLPNTDNPYVQIDDYNGLGVNTGYYLVSMVIRGWSNTHVGNMSLVKSSNGSEFYLMGATGGNVGTITVEYFFATTVDVI